MITLEKGEKYFVSSYSDMDIIIPISVENEVFDAVMREGLNEEEERELAIGSLSFIMSIMADVLHDEKYLIKKKEAFGVKK